MEEDQAVWNELDLSCLPDYDSSSITTPFPATNTLQDFHSSTILSSHFNIINSPTTEDSLSFSHAISLRPPPNKRPLSLNPEPNYLSFPFVETRAQPPLLSNPVQQSGSSTSLTTATTTTVVAKKQRVQKKSVIITPEKRYMQMIRNRGYALRARARKKAYNKDLELQLDQLHEENERLEIRIQRLKISVEQEFPEKSTSLNRALTAPF